MTAQVLDLQGPQVLCLFFQHTTYLLSDNAYPATIPSVLNAGPRENHEYAFDT